jgi:predicted lipoprotein with Yx(FWY)xxD motif
MRYPAVLLSALLLWSCGSSDDDDRPSTSSAEAQVATNPPAPATTVPPEEQVVVTDSNGMTIYYHDRDKPNESRCNNRCAQFWFPVRPAPQFAGAPGFGVITRLDGTQQVTFQGRPLYTFHKDSEPGDTRGDGNQNIWHALRY